VTVSIALISAAMDLPGEASLQAEDGKPQDGKLDLTTAG
jgi:hypothetical protein